MIDHQDTLDGPHYEAGLVLNGRLTRLHKGGGYSGPSKKEKAEQRKQDRMFMQMMSRSSKVEMPQMPAIPPAPRPDPVPPPPSQSSADVEDAKAESRRHSAKRYGLLRTTHAGATGGYGGGTPMGGGRSLLG